jgi:hypothetical protein
MDDYLTQINFQLCSVTSYGGVTEEYLSNWKKIAGELLQERFMGEQFRIKFYYGDVWAPVKRRLVVAKTDDEKIKIIYDYLSQNINWSESYSEYCEVSLNNAFKKKNANSGELNMMMLACLSEANIKASPMLVSTRGHGKPIMDYPIMKQFNHLLHRTW